MYSLLHMSVCISAKRLKLALPFHRTTEWKINPLAQSRHHPSRLWHNDLYFPNQLSIYLVDALPKMTINGTHPLLISYS